MSVFVIAEAGVNHGGRLERALALIDGAREAGADAVKFQLFSAKKLGRDELLPLELDYEAITRLHENCKGIEFLCTPFDVEALSFLVKLGVRRVKIASGCLENRDLLYATYRTGLPVMLSTGMSDLTRIKNALDLLAGNVTLLHCVSSYPCALNHANLNAMDTLRARFRRPVGYSDHTEGILAALAATAKNAVIIEKHLTLDRHASGPDHRSSIEPKTFAKMVRQIRAVESALGNGEKRVMACEEKTRKLWSPTA